MKKEEKAKMMRLKSELDSIVREIKKAVEAISMDKESIREEKERREKIWEEVMKRKVEKKM